MIGKSEMQDEGMFAQAKLRMLRVSPRKLNDVATLVRRMKVAQALVQLEFSRKRISQDVKKCLMSAIANAENNHNMDVDKLVISSILVGKAIVMKRFMPRARGKAGKIRKMLSNITITLTEIQE